MAGTACCSTSKTSPGVRTTCAARLDLSTDFEGLGSFNLKLSHNRYWLTAIETEWRNRLQTGAIPAIFTELYHPLNWTVGLANDWLVAGYPTGAVLFTAQAATRSRANKRTTSRAGIDLGEPWGRFGEFRLGLGTQRVAASPTLVAAGLSIPPTATQASETGLRLAVVVDQLDFASFPQHGYRLQR